MSHLLYAQILVDGQTPKWLLCVNGSRSAKNALETLSNDSSVEKLFVEQVIDTLTKNDFRTIADPKLARETMNAYGKTIYAKQGGGVHVGVAEDPDADMLTRASARRAGVVVAALIEDQSERKRRRVRDRQLLDEIVGDIERIDNELGPLRPDRLLLPAAAPIDTAEDERNKMEAERLKTELKAAADEWEKTFDKNWDQIWRGAAVPARQVWFETMQAIKSSRSMSHAEKSRRKMDARVKFEFATDRERLHEIAHLQWLDDEFGRRLRAINADNGLSVHLQALLITTLNQFKTDVGSIYMKLDGPESVIQQQSEYNRKRRRDANEDEEEERRAAFDEEWGLTETHKLTGDKKPGPLVHILPVESRSDEEEEEAEDSDADIFRGLPATNENGEFEGWDDWQPPVVPPRASSSSSAAAAAAAAKAPEVVDLVSDSD